MVDRTAPAQLRAIAEFGAYALRATDLDDLLHEACRQVMAALDADFSKVLEQRTDGDLLVRAGLNLKPTAVGTVVPGDIHSAAGYAVKQGAPVLSHNASKEDRFQLSKIVRDHNVCSLCNVPIYIATGVYGVLEVDSLKPNAFAEQDVPFLQNYANLLGAAIDRMRSAARLEAISEERRTLLRELQHRVKNDFQAVIGLIGRVARDSGSIEERHRLDNLRSQIMALGLVHERLYREVTATTVELGSYLAEVARGCIELWAPSLEEQVTLKPNVATISVGHEIAVPLGLIVNEFITNSAKYAFPLGKGTIFLDLEEIEPGRLRLHLADTGIGLPEGPGRRSGLQLIEALARQLTAESDWSAENGTRLTLILPLN